MPDDRPPIPVTVSRYRLRQQIRGEGSDLLFGGVDLRSYAPVAVRLLWSAMAGDEAFHARFETNAHVASLLDSPHILKLLDSGLESGWYYAVTEAVEGVWLADRLQQGPLQASDATEIAIDVARALEEAETRGIVHRELSPENILVSGKGTTKVAGFGLAGNGWADPVAMTGAFARTPQYDAPELARGQIDHRSDQYSLGALLYHMTVGWPPFAGAPLDVMRQHESAPVPLEPLARVPSALCAIMLRCLAKDPSQRFATAADLLRDLLAAQEAIRHLPPPPPAGAFEQPSWPPFGGQAAPWPAVGRADYAAPGSAAAASGWPTSQGGPGFAAPAAAGSLPGWQPARPAAARYQSPTLASVFLAAALVVDAVLALVAAALITTYHDVNADRTIALTDAGDNASVALGFQIILLLATWPFLAWFGARFCGNANALLMSGRPVGAFMSTWSWIVPLANHIVPFIAIHRAATGSFTGRDRAVVIALNWVWCALAFAGLCLWISVLAVDATPEQVLSGEKGRHTWQFVAEAGLALVAAATAFVPLALGHIQRRAAERAGAVA